MSDTHTIRKAAVAGSFYPAGARQIRTQIGDYLSRVDEAPPRGRVLALICPHAGYIYSGQVAAHAYKLLEGQPIETAIVISPSHVEFFRFASVFDGDGYETPLGILPVNREIAGRIAAKSGLVRLSEQGHMQERMQRQEHALEVQLPFLQVVLGDCAIVPIVMGDQSWEVCQALADAIAPELQRPGVVVIASSDLSHFHSEDEAHRLDGVFRSLLEQMEMPSLYEAVRKDKTEACGAGPVIASVLAARSAGGTQCRVLATATSADVTHDRSSVVGYLSAAVIGAPDTGKDKAGTGSAARNAPDERKADTDKPARFELTAEERSYLLALARHAIAQRLGIDSPAPEPVSSRLLDEKSGAFVTLKIDGRLRGCIGYIEALRPMRTAVTEMAQAAAFDDPRFNPLTADEFPLISLEISVLSPVRRVTSIDEIEVGRHGLIIERGSQRGLLLPQVATEYGWNRKQFLEHTCQKAMLPPDAWQESGTSIYLFSAEVFGEEDTAGAE